MELLSRGGPRKMHRRTAQASGAKTAPPAPLRDTLPEPTPRDNDVAFHRTPRWMANAAHSLPWANAVMPLPGWDRALSETEHIEVGQANA